MHLFPDAPTFVFEQPASDLKELIASGYSSPKRVNGDIIRKRLLTVKVSSIARSGEVHLWFQINEHLYRKKRSTILNVDEVIYQKVISIQSAKCCTRDYFLFEMLQQVGTGVINKDAATYIVIMAFERLVDKKTIKELVKLCPSFLDGHIKSRWCRYSLSIMDMIQFTKTQLTKACFLSALNGPTEKFPTFESNEEWFVITKHKSRKKEMIHFTHPCTDGEWSITWEERHRPPKIRAPLLSEILSSLTSSNKALRKAASIYIAKQRTMKKNCEETLKGLILTED